MTIDSRDGVAIAQLITYVFSLFIAVYLGWRHGFTRSSGWFYLILFSIVRIMASAFQLAIIGSPRNVSLYAGALVLQNIAVAPLELTTLGLLSRVLTGAKNGGTPVINPRFVRLLQLVVTVGLILGIVGGTKNISGLSGSSPTLPSNSISKVSVILYLVGFLALTAVLVVLYGQAEFLDWHCKRIMLAVAASLPFLLVRIIYSVISIFTGSRSFKPVIGNVTIFIVMSVIEEWIIVIIYEGVGLSLPAASHHDSQKTTQHADKQSRFDIPMVEESEAGIRK